MRSVEVERDREIRRNWKNSRKAQESTLINRRSEVRNLEAKATRLENHRQATDSDKKAAKRNRLFQRTDCQLNDQIILELTYRLAES